MRENKTHQKRPPFISNSKGTLIDCNTDCRNEKWACYFFERLVNNTELNGIVAESHL